MSAVLPYRPAAGKVVSDALRRRAKRFATFAPIVLLHLGFFYALQNGMAQHVVTLPAEVFATLIQPEASRPAPPPAPVKTVAPLKVTVPTLTQVAVPDIAVANVSAAPAPTRESSPALQAVPTQAAIAAPVQPKTISTVEYLQPPQPEYPAMSRRMGEQGKVFLRILVDERGRPERIDLQRSSGFPRLDEAARIAASHALFKPHVEDGKAIPVYVVVPIGFSLD
jgi:protein TonB